MPALKRAAQQVVAAAGETAPAAPRVTLPPPFAVGEQPALPPGSPNQQPNPPAPIVVRKDGFSTLPSVPVKDVSELVKIPTETVTPAKERVSMPPHPSDVVPLGPVPSGERPEDAMQRINRVEQPEAIPEIRPAVSSATVKSGSVSPASASSQSSTTIGKSAPSGPAGTPRKLINQRQVMLNYFVEHVGTSGVGKVEIWITNDQSLSWRKLSEDAERKSPVTVELPGEGLYGITMVVSNGRGFGGTPPRPGDVPDYWVEVDMTRPAVEIKEIRSGGADDPGTVHVTWNVQDRNLSAEPVDLYYATSREGSWTLIAKGLRNDGRGQRNNGHYRWAPPASLGSQVFLRLVAHDLAGNATVIETAQPFAVDDMSRPRGRLIDVVPVSPDLHLEPISQ